MLVNQLAVLRQTYRAAFMNGFTSGTPLAWDRIATRVPSDSAQNDYAWLGQMPEMREWIGERAVKDLTQHSYSLVNRKFEGTVSVKRDDINDNKAVEQSILVQMLGQQVRKHPDRLVADAVLAGGTTLCYDGQFFFDTDHPMGTTTVANDLSTGGGSAPWYVLDTSKVLKPFLFQVREDYEFEFRNDPGDESIWRRDVVEMGSKGRVCAGYALWQTAIRSRATLDATSFNAAWTAMTAFESDEGRNLGCVPTLLVAPMSLRAQVNAVIKAERLASGASNTDFQAVEVLLYPELT